MFERFTNEGRRVLVLAQEVAKENGSPAIRRHHMLIGLLDEPSDITAAVLDDAGVDRADLRAQLVASLIATQSPVDTDEDYTPPFTSEAKKALEVGLREALQLGHNYITDFHLLLSILRTADGSLADVLGTTNLANAKARAVIKLQAPQERSSRKRGWRGAQVLRGPMGRRSSLGLQSVLSRAFERAGADRNATTGDLLVALLATPGTHFAHVLASVTLPDASGATAAVDKLIAEGVVDGTEDALRVDPDSGSVTINDPDIVAQIKKLAGEGAVTPDALREILRRLQSGE